MISSDKIKQYIMQIDEKFNALMQNVASDIKGVTILEDTYYYYFLDKIYSK